MRPRPGGQRARTRPSALELPTAADAGLPPADVLADSMRGRNTTWTRIQVNLEHVPAN